MAIKFVYVEINPKTDLPVRILRTTKDALSLPAEIVRHMTRSVAVGFIRQQVVDRARRGKLILCEFCGEPVNEFTGHMHEQVPKGKHGEVSLDNCVFLCVDCHLGPDGEHGDRKWGGRNVQSKNL